MEIIHGRIIEVMESYPLELVAESGGVRRHVLLDWRVIIQSGGNVADPGALRPGMRVRIETRAGGAQPGALIATRIDIVQEA